MVHRYWRRAALARAKAASRLAQETGDAYVNDLAVTRWQEAVAWHGEDATLLRGLVNALLLSAELARSADAAREAIPHLDRLDDLDPNDPRRHLLRGLAYALIGDVDRDEAMLREAVRLLVRVRETPWILTELVAWALAVEAGALEALAEVTGDAREATRARERRALLESYAPDVAARSE